MFLKRGWETGLSWCAFNQNPVAISFALWAPVEEDTGRSATFWDPTFLSSSADIDWQPLTSFSPPFALYTQGDCFFSYMSGYICLVEFMRLDPIKTVLQPYKTIVFKSSNFTAN